MVQLTQSLEHWLWINGYKKELALISFGHTELLTDEMWQRYMEWCQTEEGKSYLKGGKNYKEEEA